MFCLARFVYRVEEMNGMAHPKVICPHCGKTLANAEKLAWHLSRECPAFQPREERERSRENSVREAPLSR